MSQVVLEQLTLAGFGRYAGEVRLGLGPGLWNLVADNEQGKSTLVAGLTAVLFGLPSRDGGGFTQERFRNWQGPPQFRGALTLQVDGVRYRIERQFEKNEVALLREDAGGMRQVFRTLHNPQARKSDEQYENWLRAHLGLSSRDLFAATFCLTQPLPEGEQLDAEVQQLLAGAGAGSFEAALRLLAEWAKEVTRYTGDLGLTPRNGRMDQELEQLEIAIAGLEAAIQRSAGALDNLEAIGRELEAARLRVAELQRERQEQSSLLAAWREWLDLHDERRRALRRAAELQEGLEAGRRLEGQIQSLQQEIATRYAGWLDLPGEPGETGARLEELARLQAEAGRLGRERERLQGASRQAEERLAALRERLRTEYQDVAGRPDLPAQHRELLRRQGEIAALDQRLAALDGLEAHLQERLAGLRSWERLGTAPAAALGQLRQLAREAYKVRESLLRTQSAITAARAELQQRFAWFESADSEQLELFQNYPTLRARLAMDLKGAEVELQAAEERYRAWQAEAAAFAAAYGDLEHLGADAEAVISRKIELQAEERAAREELERAQAAVATARERLARFQSLAAASAGLAAAATITWFLADQLGMDPEAAAAYGLFAGGLAGTAAWNLAGRYGRDEEAEARAAAARETLAALAEQSRGVDFQLGPFAGAGPVALGELRRRLQDRQQARERLERLAGAAPAPEALAELRQRLEGARAELGSLEREVAAAGEAPGESPDRLYSRWKEQRRLLAEAEARLRELAATEFGTDPEHLAGLPVAGLEGKWRELATLAAVTGTAPGTAGELLDWLGSLTPAQWEEWGREAAEWEEQARRLGEIQVERRQLREPGPDGRTARERLEAEVAALARAVHPFTAASDPEQVARRVREAMELEQTAKEEAAALATLERELRTLEEQRERAARSAAAQRAGLAAVLAPAGDDVEAAREQWAAYTRARLELDRLQRDLQILLEARGVRSLAQLAERLDEARSDAFGARRQQQELRRRHPSLPDPAEEHDPLWLQNTQAELQARVARLEQEARAAEEAELDLRRRQAELQGREVINVAAAELQLRELQQRRAERIRKRDALALAYRELKAAVEAYQESHRERLSQAATGYFAEITGSAGRQVVVDPEFRILVYEPDGRPVPPAQLSQGARDQLYFALRLAIADLMAAAVRLPLILDDPFVNSDAGRLARIREALERVGADRQVFLLSHDPAYREWGTPAELRNGAETGTGTQGG